MLERQKMAVRNCRPFCFIRLLSTNRLKQDAKGLVKHHTKLFEEAKLMADVVNQDKFKHVMVEFQRADKYRRGHMTFITLALARIEEFDLNTNLLTYNRLLDLFPKGKYNNKNLLDAVWPKPHPQIDLALKVLQKMEENGVRPDNVTYSVLVDIFGRDSLPVEKCKRMAFWFDRFEHADPYHIPGHLPDSPEELGSLIISRITSNIADIAIHKVPEQICFFLL